MHNALKSRYLKADCHFKIRSAYLSSSRVKGEGGGDLGRIIIEVDGGQHSVNTKYSGS
jgi:hypothetical protein